MADGVDPAAQVDQAPALSPATDTFGVEAGGEHLPASDHTMLTLGERPDQTDGVFVFHADT